MLTDWHILSASSHPSMTVTAVPPIPGLSTLDSMELVWCDHVPHTHGINYNVVSKLASNYRDRGDMEPTPRRTRQL